MVMREAEEGPLKEVGAGRQTPWEQSRGWVPSPRGGGSRWLRGWRNKGEARSCVAWRALRTLASVLSELEASWGFWAEERPGITSESQKQPGWHLLTECGTVRQEQGDGRGCVGELCERWWWPGPEWITGVGRMYLQIGLPGTADELMMGSVLSYCRGNVSLQVCALQSPRSRCCQVRFSVRAPFLPVDSHLPCPHVAKRVSAGGSSLSKGTNPSLGAPLSWPHLS